MNEAAKWDGNVNFTLPEFPGDGTIYTHLFVKCKDCGSRDFTFRDEPFYAFTDKSVPTTIRPQGPEILFRVLHEDAT